MNTLCSPRQGARKRTVLALLFALALAAYAPAALAAACETLSPSSANVLGFGTDYLPRVDFHPGEGDQELCVLSLPADLPGDLSFPLYAYNLQGQMTGARLRLVSSAPITGFSPAAGVTLTQVGGPGLSGSLWWIDIVLSGRLCGPALLGELGVTVPWGATTVFADAVGFGGVGAPVVVHESKGELPAVTPRHGAYAGETDLYHCQLPLCPEPNAPVSDFAPLQSGGYLIELGWTAGGGDFTMIRYRVDGTPPTSIFDGELLVLMPTNPGEMYALIHEYPQHVQFWYTAFSVTMSGGDVSLGSRLECDSFTTATVDESIPVPASSWGTLKNLYR